MSNIDERIVKMTLDTVGFNKSAQNTISTLDKLKMALKFGETAKEIDALEKTANALNFDKLNNSVSSISNRFSTMGIVGMTAIQRLTNAAITAGNVLTHKVLDPIMTGGWSRATKIDQAKFKIEGLGNSWDDVRKQIDYGVSGTAYGLDQAANAAAQLIASGLSFDKSLANVNEITKENADDLSKTLLAISGAAAMTSADYDLLADIFVDAAAAGKVSADTFNRISAQGLNAKATLGETLNKTQAEIDEMSRKGQISFKEFADAMYEAYGDQAKKSNETLEGALANMKSALSRIGAEFATPLRVFWRDIYNSTRLKINELKKILETSGVFKTFEQITVKAGALLTRIIDSVPVEFFKGIADAANDALVYIDGLLDGLEQLVDFLPWVSKKQADTAKDTAETAKQAARTEEEILEMANRVRSGEFGNGEEVRRKALEELGYSYELVQNKVNELEGVTFRYAVTEEELAKTTKEIKKGEKDLVPYMDKEKKTKRDLIEAYDEGNRVSKHTLEIQKKMREMTPKVTDSINGLQSAFNILKGVGGAALKGGLEPMQSIGLSIVNTFLDLTSAAGRFFTNLDNALKESGAYEDIANGINFILTNVADTFDTIESFISDITSGPGINFSEIFGKDAEGEADSISTAIGNAIGNFNELLRTIGGYLLSDGADGIGAIGEKIQELYPILSNIWPILFDITSKITAFNASKALNSVFKTINQVPKLFKAMTHQMNAEALRNLAISVALIAGSFFLLAQLSWEQIAKGAVAITAVAAALMILWVAFDKIGSTATFFKGHNISFITDLTKSFARKNNATAILYVAGAFAVLAGSMLLLSQLSWEQIAKGAVAIGIITVALIALMTAVSKSRRVMSFSAQIKKTINELGVALKSFLGSMSIAAIVTSLGIVVAAIGATVLKLANIPFEDGLKAMFFLGLIFAELLIVMNIIRKWDKANGGTGSIKLAIIMAVLALVVDKMGKTLTKLADVDWNGGKKALALMAALFAEMLIATGILRHWTDKTGSVKLVLIMAVLALIVDKMGSTIAKLSSVSWEDGVRSLVLMGALFAEMLIATNILRKWTGKGEKGSLKLIIIMAVFAVLVGMIGDTLVKLAAIPFDDGLRALLLLGGLFAGLLIVTKIASKTLTDVSGAIKMGVFLIAFAFAMGMVAATVYTLSKIDPNGMKQAIKAILSIAAILSAVMFFSKFMNQNLGSSIKSILPMVIAIAAFTAALYVLSTIEPKRLEAAAKAISKVMRSLSLFTFASKGFGKGKIGSTIASYLGLATVLGVITLVFDSLRDMDPQQMRTIADSLSTVMLSLSALAGATSLLGGFGGGGFLGSFTHGLGSIAALDVLLVDIGAVMGIASLINENFPELNGFLQKGIPLLETLGRGLGSVVGGFLSSAIFEPISNSFGGFGDGFEKFTTSIVNLVGELGGGEGLSEANSVIGDVSELMGTLAGTTWNTLITGVIANFADVDAVTDFTDAFANAAPHIYDLAKAFEFDTGDGVTIGAAEVAEKISAIRAVTVGLGDVGWASFWASWKINLGGERSVQAIKRFAEQLKVLAQPVYDLAAAFSQVVVTGEGASISTSDLQPIVDTVGNVIEELGSAGWGSAFASWGASVSEGSLLDLAANNPDAINTMVDTSTALADSSGGDSTNSSIEKLKKFAINLQTLAPSVYGLAAAFSQVVSVTDSEGTTIDTIDVTNLLGRIKDIGEIVKVIGNAGWSTALAGFKVSIANQGLLASAGTNPDALIQNTSPLVSGSGTDSVGESESVAKLITFAKNLEALGTPVYDLAAAFSKVVEVTGSDGTVVDTIDANNLLSKIKSIGEIIKVLGDVAWQDAITNFKIDLATDGLLAGINDPAAQYGIDSLNQMAGVSGSGNAALKSSTDTSSPFGKAIAFANSLQALADPLYNVAFAFSEIRVKDDITIDGEAIRERLDFIKGLIQQIGNIGTKTFFAEMKVALGTGTFWQAAAQNPDAIADINKIAGGTINGSAVTTGSGRGKSSTFDDLVTFANDMQTLADPLYNLAEAFSGITTAEGVEIDGNSIGKTLENIKGMIKSIGDIGTKTFFADIKVALADGSFWSLAASDPDALAAIDQVHLLAQSGGQSGSGTFAKITEFANDLKELSTPLYEMSKAFSEVTDAKTGEITKISTTSMARNLEAVSGILSTLGGISWQTIYSRLDFIFGKGALPDISEFCTSLANQADPIIKVGQAFAGLTAPANADIETAERMTAGIAPIAELIDEITSASQKAESLNTTGVQILADNAERLKNLAHHINQYSIIAGLFDSDALAETNPLVQALIDAINSIKLDDKNKLNDLGSPLVQFGRCLRLYSVFTGKITPSDIGDVNTPLTELISAVNGIKIDGTTLASFSTNLETLGTNLKGFNVAVGKADFTNARKVIEDINSIVETLTKLDQTLINNYNSGDYLSSSAGILEANIGQLFGAVETMIGTEGRFSETLGNIGQAIMTAMVKGMVATPEDAEAIIAAMYGTEVDKKSADAGQATGNAFGTATTDEIAEAISKCGPEIQGILMADGGPLQTISSSIEGYSDNIVGVVNEIMTTMQSAIQNSSWRFKIAISLVLNAVIRTAKSFQTSFRETGDYIMQGLEKGINDKYDTIIASVRQKTDNMLNDMNQVAEVNSPSKRTLRLGLSIMEGLQMGIDQGAPAVYSTAGVTAASMIRTMSDSVTTEADSTKQQLFTSLVGLYSLVNMAINEAVDTQPTITPVMDLSMIQNGANGINSLLSGYSLGAGSLSYARSMFPGTGLYGNPQAVAHANTQAAIQGIREDIRYLGETIAGMQMVLDSGTLVGSIGGGMDKELGNIQKLKERWA